MSVFMTDSESRQTLHASAVLYPASIEHVCLDLLEIHKYIFWSLFQLGKGLYKVCFMTDAGARKSVTAIFHLYVSELWIERLDTNKVQ